MTLPTPPDETASPPGVSGVARPLVDDLVAAIIQQSVDNLASTTDRLIDGLQHRLDAAEAELTVIRVGMNRMLNGPYAPSESAIASLVFSPPHDLVVEQMARLAEERARRNEP
jgi:hypothetical protein